MKKKFKSYSFWMSVCASVVLVINNVGRAFGFTIDNEAFTAIVDSVCGVLIVLGVLDMTKSENKDDDNQNQTQEPTQKKEDDADTTKN